jgi:hypothetical protein
MALAFCTPALAAEGGGGTAQWDVKGSYYETCACNVSCPCAASMKPTEAHCDAFMTFHIDKGKVGTTKLDGLNFVGVLRSPKDQVVKEAFAKHEVDLLTFYFDDKASDAQKAALGAIIPELFGKDEMKGFKPPQFVPITLEVSGDVAKLNAAGGKLAFEIENLDVGDKTKESAGKGAKKGAQRIKLTNTAPFPWIADPTQGRSKSFHFDDLGTKWDYSGRNAYFSSFTAKGTTKLAAAAAPAAKTK